MSNCLIDVHGGDDLAESATGTIQAKSFWKAAPEYDIKRRTLEASDKQHLYCSIIFKLPQF
jgi:hypothetical protein